jgi:hypothetical protein
VIPDLEPNGNLGRGVYDSSWIEFLDRFVWNAQRRRIAAALHSALLCLARAECDEVLVGGSFVSSKESPGDVDVLYLTPRKPELLPEAFLTRHRPSLKADFCGDYIEDEPAIRRFFSTDRNGNARGFVRLDISSPEWSATND